MFSEGQDRAVIVLTEDEIQPLSAIEAVRSDTCGALVLFAGSVRSPSRGREVSSLFYESYREMALKKMEEIAGEAESRWDLGGIALIHRTGRVRAGEISILIAVSSPHRDEAYAASRFLIEEVKEKVPIWKKELSEGDDEWI